MKRLKRLGRTTSAVGIGLGPGLLLPFMLALRLSPADSDRAVLTFSVATSLIGIVVPATEAKIIAIAGQLARRTGAVSQSTYRELLSTTLRWTIPVTVVGAIFLSLLYGSGHPDQIYRLILVSVIAVAPILASISAVNSGVLVSRGRTTLTISTQGLRAIVPLAALFAVPRIAPLLLAALFVAGELTRLVLLTAARRRLPRVTLLDDTDSQEVESRGGLPWQMSANAVGELNPIAARTYLKPYPSGSITAFELSEKILGLSTQVAYNFVTLQRVGRWSMASPLLRHKVFRRDSLITFAVATGTISLCVLGIQIGIGAGLAPKAWTKGLEWACVALIGGPAVSVNSGAVRYVAILGSQRWLAAVSAIVVAVNALLIGLFLILLGPLGVVVTMVVTRYMQLICLLVLIRRRERGILKPQPRRSRRADRGVQIDSGTRPSELLSPDKVNSWTVNSTYSAMSGTEVDEGTIASLPPGSLGS